MKWKKDMTTTSMQAITDKVLSHEIFKDIDTSALLNRHVDNANIIRTNAAAKPTIAPQVQAGNTISSIPPEGIAIDSPGTYVFSDTISWAPEATSCAAITIACSDVVLDMAGYNLSATIKDSSQHLIGIDINAGCNGVSIKNGTLVNMGYYGIHADQVTQITIEHVTVSGLIFRNLDKRGLCPAGIFVSQAMDVTITDCTVQYLYATADCCAGIHLVSTTRATVTGCKVSNLTNYDGVVVGFYYAFSSMITTTDCHAKDCQSHFGGNIRAVGHTVLGFMPVISCALTYRDCTATNIIGSADDCHGMSVFLDAAVTVTNFIAKNVTDGVTPTHSGAKATGLEVYGYDILIEHCTVENIKAINPQDKQATGFSAWGKNILFKGCTANNVSVVDEQGNEGEDLGYGTGFGWAPDPRLTQGAYTVEYAHCTANQCQVGFDTWYHVDSIWTDVHHATSTIGILVQPDAKRTLSANPASECNPPVVITLTNIATGNVYPRT